MSASIALLALSSSSRADLDLPRPSPTAKITQQVWFNVLGCGAVVALAFALDALSPRAAEAL